MISIQKIVGDFVNTNGLEAPLEARLLDLMSEVGELSKEVLKATQYGHKPFVVTSSFSDEIGDVAFALACIANTASVDLEECVRAAVGKYRARLVQSGQASSSR